jgi:hypothetical protein
MLNLPTGRLALPRSVLSSLQEAPVLLIALIEIAIDLVDLVGEVGSHNFLQSLHRTPAIVDLVPTLCLAIFQFLDLSLALAHEPLLLLALRLSASYLIV